MEKTKTCLLYELSDCTETGELDSKVHEGITIRNGKRMY